MEDYLKAPLTTITLYGYIIFLGQSTTLKRVSRCVSLHLAQSSLGHRYSTPTLISWTQSRFVRNTLRKQRTCYAGLVEIQKLYLNCKIQKLRCERCEDPTDLGTYGNAVLCRGCKGPVIPMKEDPGSWQCQKCMEKILTEEVV